MTKKRSLSFSKFISANRFLLLTCLLIVGGGLYFALSRQQITINSVSTRCSSISDQAECLEATGCRWEGQSCKTKPPSVTGAGGATQPTTKSPASPSPQATGGTNLNWWCSTRRKIGIGCKSCPPFTMVVFYNSSSIHRTRTYYLRDGDVEDTETSMLPVTNAKGENCINMSGAHLMCNNGHLNVNNYEHVANCEPAN